jgi:1-acyl-sn-glycerol-3-phosphate acyltransferase
MQIKTAIFMALALPCFDLGKPWPHTSRTSVVGRAHEELTKLLQCAKLCSTARPSLLLGTAIVLEQLRVLYTDGSPTTARNVDTARARGVLPWMRQLFCQLYILSLRRLLFIMVLGMAALMAHAKLFMSEDQVWHFFVKLHEWFGWAFFRYNVANPEVLPRTGNGMIVFYHGPSIPVDSYLFVPRIFQLTGRRVKALVASFMFHIPIARDMFRYGAMPGDRKSALAELAAGGVVAVAPGGIFESITGTPGDYKLSWAARKGFAEVAQQARAPIIPMFTRNVRHTFWLPLAGTWFARWLYERTGIGVLSLLGLGPLPVQLTTYLGEPIQTADVAVEDIVRQTRESILQLIRRHQMS